MPIKYQKIGRLVPVADAPVLSKDVQNRAKGDLTQRLQFHLKKLTMQNLKLRSPHVKLNHVHVRELRNGHVLLVVISKNIYEQTEKNDSSTLEQSSQELPVHTKDPKDSEFWGYVKKTNNGDFKTWDSFFSRIYHYQSSIS